MALCITKLVAFSILFTSAIFHSANSHSFARSLLPHEHGLKEEKLSHLHFYFHDTVSGRNPTAVLFAEAKMTNASATRFGSVFVIDDLLTEGPEMSPKIVGRAQGIDSSASLNDLGLLMVQNYLFAEGKYNGSTLSVLGRNALLSNAREMPIVGRNRLFRFARGYAQVRTHMINLQTGNAVVDDALFSENQANLALGVKSRIQY